MGNATMPQVGLKKRVIWLMAYRLAIVTLLMGATALIHSREGGGLLVRSAIPIYILIGISYLTTFLSLIALRFVRKIDRFANLQVAADTILATALIYVTGGIDSIFSFLYIFIIIGAGILHGRGVFLTASLNSILYGALLNLQYYGYMPRFGNLLEPPQAYSGPEVLYNVFINITTFYITALLSGYLFGQLRETGERLKEKEIDYEELEALNRKIVREISSGLMTIDKDGFITSFNRAAEEITGYTLRETYKTKADAIFPGLMEKVSEFGTAAASRRRVGRWEAAHRRKDGNLLHLGFSISSRGKHEGSEMGSIIIFEDLTHFKEMEEAVKHAERLASMGKVAAGIAHEIRNPLASMSSSIQILRDELRLGEGDRGLMDIILKEMDRINGLIGNFLEYARPYKPQKKGVDLSGVMAETLGVFEKGLSQNQEIRVKKEITPGIRVGGEEGRLREVLWNLLNNAAQSMHEGGEIAVSLRNDNGKAVAVIKDSGEGIEEKDIKRVFEPFFTTKARGTGLGLATVHRIVEAHGGEINVESEKGKGTTFTVILPVE